MGENSHRFLNLDALRGLAAIFVVYCHVPGYALVSWFPTSYLAVDFFFALSGFVIAHAYQRKLAEGLDVLSFMRVRIVRLYPLYILGTAIGATAFTTAALTGAGSATSTDPMDAATTIMSALVFLPTPPEYSVSSGFIYPLNYPAWSLFFELGVNAAFALVAPFLTRGRLLGILAASAALLVATSLVFKSLFVGGSPEHMIGGVGRVFFSFFCGVALYRLWASGWLGRVRAPLWLPAALLVAIFSLRVGPEYRAIVDPLLVIAGFPLIIVLASASAQPTGRFARACALLGAASYGVYVLHVPILAWLELIVPYVLGHHFNPGIDRTLALTAVIVVAAIAADALYDAPARRRLLRIALRL